MQTILPPPPQHLIDTQWRLAHLITEQNTDKSTLPHYDPHTLEELRAIITPGIFLSSEKCIKLYQLRYWKRIFKTLEFSFPTLLRILGTSSFSSSVSIPFFSQSPPPGNETEAQFVEWARHHSWHHEEISLFDAILLDRNYHQICIAQAKPEIRWEQFPLLQTEVIHLQTFVIPLALQENLCAFREIILQYRVKHWEVNPLPKIEAWEQKHFFAIYRTDRGIPLYQEISPVQYFILSALQQGSTLQTMIRELHHKKMSYPKWELDLEEWLHVWVKLGWLYLES